MGFPGAVLLPLPGGLASTRAPCRVLMLNELWSASLITKRASWDLRQYAREKDRSIQRPNVTIRVPKDCIQRFCSEHSHNPQSMAGIRPFDRRTASYMANSNPTTSSSCAEITRISDLIYRVCMCCCACSANLVADHRYSNAELLARLAPVASCASSIPKRCACTTAHLHAAARAKRACAAPVAAAAVAVPPALALHAIRIPLCG